MRTPEKTIASYLPEKREVRHTMKTDEYNSNKTPVMVWSRLSHAS